MKRSCIIVSFLLIVLFNCIRKPAYVCGLASLASKPKNESEIIQLARTAIADTTIASVSGEIFGKDSFENYIVIDTAIYAHVSLIDKITGKAYSTLTDSVGKYHIQFPAAIYDIRVQSIAYNTLIIQNVAIGTGDIIKFDAALGVSGLKRDSSVYVMQEDKTMKTIGVPTEMKKQ